MEVFMECAIRKWKLEDAWNLSQMLNNKKIMDNLRDGLPYPYSRVLEKSGFILEGTLRSNAVKNGKILDMKMYAKIK